MPELASQDDLKRAVALAAVERISCHFGTSAVIGVGTGSTADLFIDALAAHRDSIAATVASSERSAARLREGFTTDNGNQILDVHGLSIRDPIGLEDAINRIAGVVTVGLFARRGADVLLLGGPEGVAEYRRAP